MGHRIVMNGEGAGHTVGRGGAYGGKGRGIQWFASVFLPFFFAVGKEVCVWRG